MDFWGFLGFWVGLGVEGLGGCSGAEKNKIRHAFGVQNNPWFACVRLLRHWIIGCGVCRQTSDPLSGYATAEKAMGSLTPMLGDQTPLMGDRKVRVGARVCGAGWEMGIVHRVVCLSYCLVG